MRSSKELLRRICDGVAKKADRTHLLRRATVETMETRRLFAAYHLTFDDEFNSLNLATSGTDTKPWSALDYWGNHYVGSDQQYYSNPLTESINPFSVANGSLSIKAQPTPSGFNAAGKSYVSGEITTAPRNQYGTNPGGVGFSQKYGYFEMRAKLPPGSGFWPAFWLMPLGNNDAEYDIVEGLGNNTDAVYQTQHWNNYSGQEGFTYETAIDTTTGYHTYGVEWNSSTISWYVDGVKTKTGVNHSNEAMYILVNLAIGGWNNNNVNSSTDFSKTYDVDYVRVYSTDSTKPTVTPQTGYSINPNTLPIATNGLDNGFNQTDIGSTGVAGTGSYSGGVYTLGGSGTDIGGTGDSFHYGSKILIGDGVLTARLTGLTGGDSSAKAGVMMRTDWSSTAPFASLVELPGNQVQFQWRTTAGAAAGSTTVTVPAGAMYLRLTRNGSTFSGFYSTDGTTWTGVGYGQTITMRSLIQAGLAVTSHVNTSLATATFDNVSVAPSILDRTGWVPTASNTMYSETTRATDGDLVSSWYTGVSATTAMWFQLDLGSTQTFQRVVINQGTATDKQIGGYNAYVSNDGTNWGSIVGTAKVTGQYGAITFATPANARYLKLMPDANYTDWWSLTEINLATVPAVNPAPPTLPSGWTDTDIGSPGQAGSASESSGVGTGTWTVKGGGSQIYGTSDQFNLVRKTVSGDQTMIARVTSLTNTNAAARAGVMFRDSTAANSMYASVFVTPTSGLRFSYRSSTGGTAVSSGPTGAAPVWVKLVRVGSTYTGYYATTTGTPTSTDWIQIGSSATFSFANSSYLAGLCVNASDNTKLATATFTDVSITAGGTLAAKLAPTSTTSTSTSTFSSTPVIKLLDQPSSGLRLL